MKSTKVFRDLILSKLSSNQLNVDDFDQQDSFTDHIIKNMTEKNLIGQGAVGKVFAFGKYVVKQIMPCSAKENSPLFKYCVDITKLIKGHINGIPGGNNKYRYILPNLLSEITIGLLLDDIGFTNTLSSMILDDDNSDNDSGSDMSIYIIMEQLEPLIINHQINLNLNEKLFLYMLFQVAHTLLTAQTQHKFTHYDLHIENLLFRENKKNISYPLPNQHMRVMMDSPFIIKISDFALARMETDKFILAASADDFPVKTYGEFNPSYDFACFLGSILIDNKYRVAFDALFKNKKIYQFILRLTLWYFNDSTIISDLDDLDNIRDYIANTYYKPIKKNFSFRPKQDDLFIPYLNTQSMVNVVNYLAKELILKKYVVTHQQNSIVVKDLKYYTTYDNIILYNPTLKLDQLGVDVKSMQIDEHIKVSKYFIKIKNDIKDYNLTVEPIQYETCPIQHHYFTAIDVNHKTKYQFGYDCCKLDGPNYLMQNKRIGFVINGGFFSLKKDYLPIGPYKDKFSTIDKYPIPELYKKDYRYIVLRNNQLSIKNNLEKNSEYCVSGPLLISDGKIIYKPSDQYNCTDLKHAQELMVDQNEEKITIIGTYGCGGILKPNLKIYPRCDRIDPGELTHSNNFNQRSALCILPDSYVFISFEGRGEKGYGVDLLLLSQFILKFYPTTISAINLDGGRSSNLAWRTAYNSDVYTSGIGRFYYYPSGSLITCFKNQ